MNEGGRGARGLGMQYAIELYGCRPERLANCEDVEAVLRAVGREIGATVLSGHFHQFAPAGVSGVLVISESHLAIHTWPEHRYAAVDLFTCGPRRLHPADAVAELRERWGASHVEVSHVERGPALLLDEVRDELAVGVDDEAVAPPET